MVSTNAHLRLIDRPCGTGKTSQMLKSFQENKCYIVILPTLDEVERVIRDASVPFLQPDVDNSDHETKREHLRELLLSGQNVATTHKLYQEVAILAREGLLDQYHICLDEVLDVCAAVDGKSSRSFEQFYVKGGYARVDHKGRVSTTPKWEAELDAVSDTLSVSLYRLAKAEMLHYVDGTFFMWALPQELLTAGASFTIYTYLAEGSTLLAYLNKLQIPYLHDVDVALEARFRAKAKQLVTIKDIPSMSKVNLTYSGQTQGKSVAKVVSRSLRSLRRGELKDVPLSNVLITSVKNKWYAKGNDDPKSRKAGCFAVGTKMFKDVTWIANTTRGTNNFAHATHLVYLYDQNMNPFIKRWLGLASDLEAQDRYALTELIQWAYRSRVRMGEPITLFLPSKRMRGLLENWLQDGGKPEVIVPEKRLAA
ncbi:MAG: hypothetical protein ABJM80_19230 [Sulfitobacter pontiacus]|uniref:hypothetical protein n=1 Tax=Sulfitobacter pontiacus TaxID=60137 RepID=UPI003299C93B